MTVRLRPHHLLCLLTYAGKGYSPAFVENFDRIAARIAAGASISVVAGPDDVCAPWATLPESHCHNPSITARDDAARAALAPLLGTLAPDTTFTLPAEMIARLRDAFRDGSIRAACVGCEWAELCTGIAAGGYAPARLP